MGLETPGVQDGAEPRARRLGARVRTAAGRVLPFLAGVLAVLIAFAAYGVVVPGPHQLTAADVDQAIASTLASQTPAPALSEQAYAVIRPSVVVIETTEPASSGDTGHGLGSGVVIDGNADILTSLHVVSTATNIKLTFADGTQSSADVVTRSPANDIAVLHASQPSPNLVPATLGNPNQLAIGDDAFVVGNPFGLTGSISAGVVSGLGRSFEVPETHQTLHGLIQVDAAVNPGNSGGPLVDRNGQVVGIVAALVNPTSQDVFIGIGLAVPIDVAGGAAGLPPD